ncbi:MAG: glycerol-3-phosphate acyltransferase [Lachnospiraceae bacterium]|nr:glycerol-3-phosphate acyltransferase [Lachnospiraceae bacterium]
MNINSNNGKQITVLNVKGWAVLIIMTLTVFLMYSFSKAEENDEYVFSKTEDSIIKTFVDNGYSVAGACGILGNMSVENPKFEADLLANNGNTYGLFQWTDTGERRASLKRWCNNRVLNYRQIDGQLAFAMHELQGGDPVALRVNHFLKITEDPEIAAMEFAVGFERCIGQTSNHEIDGIYTGTLYPEFYGQYYQALNRRIENAKKYYDGYKNAYLPKELVIAIDAKPTVGLIAEREEKMEEELHETMFVVDTSPNRSLWGYRVLSLVIGYLFGCILGIVLIIRNVRQKEELHIKDKLPSFLTVLKHVGIKETLLAALIDILKLYAALLLVYFITKGALGSEEILLVGSGILLGNAYPFWHRFKGGMGLIVTAAFFCTYMPIWGYICCIVGLIIAIFAKSLSFGAICVFILAVPYAFMFKGLEAGIFITFAILLMLHKHYRFLKKYIGHELLKKHYSQRTSRFSFGRG